MPPNSTKAPPNTREVIAISLIRILIDGPLVSFRGSPTVSPTTAALCASLPFFWTTPLILRLPASMVFFALSQAPPVFEKLMATYTPETIAPASRPQTPRGPSRKPIASGEAITRMPGAIICCREA